MNPEIARQFENIVCGTEVQIPEQVKAMIEDSLEKARTLYEGMSPNIKAGAKAYGDVVEALQTGSKALGEQLLKNATANVDATFNAAHAVARARTIPEVVSIQTQFGQQQMARMAEQMHALFDLTTKLGSETAVGLSAMVGAATAHPAKR